MITQQTTQFKLCSRDSIDFPGGSDGKASAYNVGDLGSIPGLGRSPGGGHGNPLQYSCLQNLHGQRNVAGYSPWDCEELDTTEQLSRAQHSLIGIAAVRTKCCGAMGTLSNISSLLSSKILGIVLTA